MKRTGNRRIDVVKLQGEMVTYGKIKRGAVGGDRVRFPRIGGQGAENMRKRSGYVHQCQEDL
jgi:hypothetical protein